MLEIELNTCMQLTFRKAHTFQNEGNYAGKILKSVDGSTKVHDCNL